jgi:hypothetical protein
MKRFLKILGTVLLILVLLGAGAFIFRYDIRHVYYSLKYPDEMAFSKKYIDAYLKQDESAIRKMSMEDSINLRPGTLKNV